MRFCFSLKKKLSSSLSPVLGRPLNWNTGLSPPMQVGSWTSRAKCAATAARGNTTVFTPATAARDSSRGASAGTGPTSANPALRWGLLAIYSYPTRTFIILFFTLAYTGIWHVVTCCKWVYIWFFFFMWHVWRISNQEKLKERETHSKSNSVVLIGV